MRPKYVKEAKSSNGNIEHDTIEMAQHFLILWPSSTSRSLSKQNTTPSRIVPFRLKIRVAQKFNTIGNPNDDVQSHVLQRVPEIIDDKLRIKVVIWNRKSEEL